MKSEFLLLWHLLYVSLCARNVSHVVGAPEEEDKEPEGSKMSFAFSSHRMDQACLSSARRSIKEKSLWPLLSSRIAKHAMIFSHAFCQTVFPPRYDQEDMEKTLKV
jgi:hypothetical protein